MPRLLHIIAVEPNTDVGIAVVAEVLMASIDRWAQERAGDAAVRERDVRLAVLRVLSSEAGRRARQRSLKSVRIVSTDGRFFGVVKASRKRRRRTRLEMLGIKSPRPMRKPKRHGGV